MLTRIAWGFCNIAFEASRDHCFPGPMRRLFQRFGVMWFWAALACERRALEIWLELRCERRKQRLEPAGLAIADAAGDCPGICAWSLPDNTRMKGLGLGRVWAVMCPYCQQFHTHAPGEVRRSAHCRTETMPRTYLLRHAGDMPRELREKFRVSVTGDLPRFLLEGPDDTPTPESLEAA